METFDTLQKPGHKGSASQDQDPSLLVFVLDTNPAAWEALNNAPSLDTALTDVLVFINAHLALNHANQTAVIASHVGVAKYLYPSPDASSQSMGQYRDPAREANSYRPFINVQDGVLESLRALYTSTPTSAVQSSSSMLSGAITLALSYINRQRLALGESVRLQSRITVLSVSGDQEMQYIPMMNSIFAAQKMEVCIDILKLGGDQVFLQQASDATRGLYHHLKADDSGTKTDAEDTAGAVATTTTMKMTPPMSILQTLLMLFLPDRTLRHSLTRPTNASVDFRAACFCHKRVLDIGYVCSVCLSIFCRVYPVCITCDTEFDAAQVQALGARPVVVMYPRHALPASQSTLYATSPSSSSPSSPFPSTTSSSAAKQKKPKSKKRGDGVGVASRSSLGNGATGQPTTTREDSIVID